MQVNERQADRHTDRRHALTCSLLTIELLQSIHTENTFFAFIFYTSVLYVYMLHILYLDLEDAAYTQLY